MKYCSAITHSEKNCLNTAIKNYQKVFKGQSYFVCPECETVTIGTFDEFRAQHPDHLIGFSEKKDVVFKIGKFYY